jgi:hypothetical protein
MSRYVLALVVAALAPLQASGGAVPALRFDWPTNVTAHVDTEFRHEYSDGQVVFLSSWLQMTHRMRVSPHADGRLIQYDDQTYVASLGDLEPAVAALLPLWVPTQIVDGDGRFLRMENAERVQQHVIDLFASKGGTELVQRVPVFKDYVRLMTSDAGLRGLAEENWYGLVQRWIAAPVAEGALDGAGPQLVPLDQQAPSTISRRVVRRAPCSRSGTVRECVTYEITTQRDRDQLANFAKALQDSGIDGFADAALIAELKTERVTLEASTMLPHELAITRSVVTAVQEDGRVVPKINLERIRSVFSYSDEQ